MNKYETKLLRLHAHLEKCPADYQAVISFYKLRSELIFYRRELCRIEMKREIARQKNQITGGQ
ncbi:MAG: hypothetical protein FWF50_05880 [Defluviitaleaceae bacterium]|nr:hypothetical protein [Defluviitaleaceae bacterium]